MSKKRHKNRTESSNRENKINPQQSRMNMGPFGINPTQLLSMLGNVDMNQINNMIQNMNRNGIDFNNFNLSSLQNLMGNPMQASNVYNKRNNESSLDEDDEVLDENVEVSTSKKIKENNKKHSENKNEHKSVNNFEIEDENIELLKSFRKIVRTDKIEFIDRIIKVYTEGGFEKF